MSYQSIIFVNINNLYFKDWKKKRNMNWKYQYNPNTIP